MKVADELNRSEGLGIELQFPLPFPVEMYAESSTFGHGPDKQQLESEADAETFMKDRVTQAGEGAFVVPLDYPIDQTPWKELRDDPAGRHRCYSNAASYVARHCNALIALWDGKPAAGPGGTGETVAFKLDGRRPPHFPRGPAWAHLATPGRCMS